MMSEQRLSKRTRIITNPAEYRRHRRRKLKRLLVRAAMWTFFVVVGVAAFWMVLEKLAP